MKNKKIVIILTAILLTITITSCKKLNKAGTYEADGKGRNGNIKVAVTVDSKGDISDIELIEYDENKQYIEASFGKIKEDVIKNNTYEVDTVSGATQTSNGIIEAIRKCIEQSQ